MDDLQARRQKAEDQFNALIKQKDQKQVEINDIDGELYRLQGEWRVIDDLSKKAEPQAKDVATGANTIDIKEKTDGKKTG